MSIEIQILTCDKIKYEFDQALDNSLRVSFSNLKKGSTQHSIVLFTGLLENSSTLQSYPERRFVDP